MGYKINSDLSSSISLIHDLTDVNILILGAYIHSNNVCTAGMLEPTARSHVAYGTSTQRVLLLREKYEDQRQ